MRAEGVEEAVLGVDGSVAVSTPGGVAVRLRVGTIVGAEVVVDWDWVQATNKSNSVNRAMIWRKCLLQVVTGLLRARPLLDCRFAKVKAQQRPFNDPKVVDTFVGMAVELKQGSTVFSKEFSSDARSGDR